MTKNSKSGMDASKQGGHRSSMRTRRSDPAQRLINQMKALAKGKDIVVTTENPNKSETNKRFIKTRVSPRGHRSP